MKGDDCVRRRINIEKLKSFLKKKNFNMWRLKDRLINETICCEISKIIDNFDFTWRRFFVEDYGSVVITTYLNEDSLLFIIVTQVKGREEFEYEITIEGPSRSQVRELGRFFSKKIVGSIRRQTRAFQ